MASEAQKVADAYKDLILSVGVEAEPPVDAPTGGFLSWLAAELRTVADLMVVGREYASMESLRAFS